MKILIAGLTTNYQFKRIKEEGEKLGYVVDGCKSTDLVIRSDDGGFMPDISNLDISSYDLIYSFISKRRWEWYTAFNYLVKKFNTKIINNLSFYPSPAAEYLVQNNNDLPMPKTFVIYSSRVIPQITKDLDFPVIVKNGIVHKGKEVYKVENENDLIKRVDEIGGSGSPVVIRQFIPNDGDVRVFTINSKAVAAMKRIPVVGEFRSNISLGGTGEKFDLNNNSEIKTLAEKASAAAGILIAGVDIIVDKNTGKPYILEINSCPQFEGLEKYTGENIALQIIKYFESYQK
jgi:ribosomal protein S6--L-glutamate ligase